MNLIIYLKFTLLMNHINESFAEMLRDEWLDIMNTFELEIDDLINQDAIDLSSA